MKRPLLIRAKNRPATYFGQCNSLMTFLARSTDYGRPESKQPSLHGRKFNSNPKFLGMAAAYFVCHIGPFFQISLIYAFIGCPQSVLISTDVELLHVNQHPNHLCALHCYWLKLERYVEKSKKPNISFVLSCAIKKTDVLDFNCLPFFFCNSRIKQPQPRWQVLI